MSEIGAIPTNVQSSKNEDIEIIETVIGVTQ